MELAVDKFTNLRTGAMGTPIISSLDAGGASDGLELGNPGRLIRLKAGPQPYSKKITYAVDDLVNFSDDIYKSLTGSNLGNPPDTDATNWEIQTTKIQWTWGQITSAVHYNKATITLKGYDLPDTLPIWEFRLGVYSDTTGWPSSGAYHEGRLCLGGVAPNRIDMGRPNRGFDFSPTEPDGTVTDSNGIAVTLNSEKAENICGFASVTEGLIVLTDEREWLIAASALNDPLTPTSTQARPTTEFSAIPVEVTRLPTGLATVQRGGRRVLEYRNFVDMRSYQSRLNTSDMSLKCQHLTASGVGMTQFQSLKQPVLWCAPGKYLITQFNPVFVNNDCPAVQQPPVVVPGGLPVITGNTLFGIAYSRSPDNAYSAPFSFEHGLTLATNYQQTIDSIAIQRGPDETSEYLYCCVTGSDQKSHVEMMMPFFETEPFDDVLTNSTTVASFGTRSMSFMLDSALSPTGCEIAADALSATFYGLTPHAGETVDFVIRGKYVGSFDIAADGSVNIPFTTADGTFVYEDIYLAMRADSINYNMLPSGYLDGFRGDASASFYQSGEGYQYFFYVDLSNSTQNFTFSFLGYFGYKFRRRGQMLRPLVGGANGPNFGKVIQNSRAGIYVGQCLQIKAGASFDDLVDIELTVDGVNDVTPLVPGQATTGIYRGFINDDNSFNGQICWEQTDPVPGNILAVGGFDEVSDV